MRTLQAILFLVVSIHLLPAQSTFERLLTGPVVNTPSDSRSVNITDLNNDAADDLYISNGPSGGAPDLIYLNEDFFELVPFHPAGLSGVSYSSVGATVADYNNDGYSDIFVATWYGHPNVLITQHETSFTPALFGSSYSESAVWGDYDKDGWLDLYVSNSGNNPSQNNNILYHNNDGVLERVMTGASVADQHNSRSAHWIDYDNDRFADLFVCNENNQPNVLYRNNRDGTFTRILSAGDLLTSSYSSMSQSWADVNNDGFQDLFIANAGYFQQQPNQMFLNNGDGTFSTLPGPWDTDGGCSYSSAFADYDNDGDIDLVVTNGFCSGAIVNFLYLNDGEGGFTRDTVSIPDLSTPCSYGVAWGDLTGNGFPDLVIATCRNTSQSPFPDNIVWENLGNDNHYLKLKLIGTGSNRDAIGATVRMKATIAGEPRWQMREVSAQTGYCSQNSLTVHFGLGDALLADSVVIEWPGGAVQVLVQVQVDSFLVITEPGSSSVTGPAAGQVSWQVMPNPARQVITISGYQAGCDQLTCVVYDTMGRMAGRRYLQAAEVTDGVFSLDLGAWRLSPGLYVLSLQGCGATESRHFSVTD